jgi:enamine deaminase RidA (YjgF/YER057c/UK114 family)
MQVLLPPDWAPPIGYVNGTAVDSGRIVFIAGQVGWNAQSSFESAEIGHHPARSVAAWPSAAVHVRRAAIEP